MLKISGRGKVPPFIVMDVMRAANERAASGGEVLHLEVGQPSTPAPEGVRRAARTALDNELIGYTDSMGLPVLRARIARHYHDYYGVDIAAERIAITCGSSGGFLLGFTAAFDAGDRVALAAPGYPAYRNILHALDIEIVEIETEREHAYQPTAALLDRVDGRLDGLIVASPANPTGSMLDRAALAELADYCRDRGTRLISDEIYHGLVYGTSATTALALTDQAIVINSFSKYYSMTGWRLGWMVLPEDMLRPVQCLSQNLFISPPTLSQHAAIAAFDCVPELEENRRRYEANRALLLSELPKAGFDRFAPPDGAFYLYADVTDITNDSVDFCRRILADTGVALTPGIDFDPLRGHRTVRFSFAGATETMAEAARRLAQWRALEKRIS